MIFVINVPANAYTQGEARQSCIEGLPVREVGLRRDFRTVAQKKHLQFVSTITTKAMLPATSIAIITL